MNTNIKFFIRVLAVLLAAGSIAAVVVRQSELTDLRAEQQTLLKDSQEADRLALENRDIDKLRAENDEVRKLRLENRDLPKLRNQVRQLRKQLDEMAKLKAENEILANQPPADHQVSVAKNQFTRENLKDVGMQLPVMTLQTFFAALTQGNMNRAMQCLTPEMAARIAAEGKGQQMLQDMKDFASFEITSRNQPSPDEINLEVKVKMTGTDENQTTIPFKLIGNEWKMSVP